MSKQQKIICLLIDSKTYGGIETHVGHLAKGLIRSGHRVNVVLITDHGIHPVFDRDELLKTITLKPTAGIFSLFQLLSALDIRVIHTHGYKAGIIGRLFGLFNNLAVISTFHAGEKGNLKMRLYAYLDRLTAFRTHCLCVSEQIAKTLGPRAQIMENFVDIPKQNTDKFKQANEIAFVGRFSEEKGPDLFCDIATKLPKQTFVMYGDGPMYQQIKQAKPANVTLIGHVESMNDYWQDIKLLCITSRAEGLPLVALEALARGIPIVCFDVGGLSTVVHNNTTGWLIAFDDQKKFISKLELACRLTTKQRAKMAIYAQQFIAHKFSSQAIIPKICQCYNSVTKMRKYA